jgi:hypothetical protein
MRRDDRDAVSGMIPLPSDRAEGTTPWAEAALDQGTGSTELTDSIERRSVSKLRSWPRV